MASPQAACSSWVQREVAWWLENRTTDRMLIVLTDGELAWDDAANDFDWKSTTAMPIGLKGQFAGVPLYVDLRWAKGSSHLSMREPRFREAIRDLAAPLHGRPKEELDGEDVQQQRQTKRIVALVAVGLLMLTGVAGWQWSERRQQQRSYYSTQAQAVQRDIGPGRQFTCLDRAKEAARIQAGKDVVNLAVACMAMPDLRKIREWKGYPSDASRSYGRAFDSELERYASSDARGNISIRRVDDDHQLELLPGNGYPAWVLRFSGNGRFLAAKHDPNHELRIWDLSENEKRHVTVAGDISAESIAFSADSRVVAFGQRDGSIQVYDLESKEYKKVARGAEPHSMAFAPEGRRLAVSSLDGGAAVRILDADKEAMSTLPLADARGGVRGLAWSPDGKLLAAASADFRVYVLDTENGAQVAALVGHQSEPTRVSFNHDGSLLASTGWDGTVRLWDPLRGTEWITAEGAGPIQFGSDGQKLAFALAGPSLLSLWKAATPREYRVLYGYKESAKGPWSADFRRDGRLMASAHSDGVRMWDLASGREVAFLDPRQHGSTSGYTRSVVFHQDGKRIITAGKSGLLVWPISSSPGVFRVGDPRPLALPPDALPWWASLAADGRTLAVADYRKGRIIVLDLEDASKEPTLIDGHKGAVFVAISLDGRRVLSASWQQQPTDLIRVSELDNRQQLRAFDKSSIAVSADFSPDGKWLVTAAEKGYQVVDLASWRSTNPFPEVGAGLPKGPVAFSQGGNLLAIAYSSRQIKLFVPGSWEETMTLEAPNKSMLHSLHFSADGSHLAGVSTNHEIHLWNLKLVHDRLAREQLK